MHCPYVSCYIPAQALAESVPHPRTHIRDKCARAGWRFGGPLLPLIRVPAVHKLPLVPSGEAVHWRLAFRILGTAPLTFQAFVLLPAKSAVLPGVLSASLSCRPLPPDSNPPACLPQQHLPAAGERLTSLKAQ